LAELWTQSQDRRKLSRIVDEIDERLRTDPFNVGESRESTSVRLAIVAGLGFRFKVVEDDAQVQVVEFFSATQD